MNLPQDFHLRKVLHDLKNDHAKTEETKAAAPTPVEKPARVRLQEAIRELLEANVSKIEVLDLVLAQLR
jgi:hypothetical protein